MSGVRSSIVGRFEPIRLGGGPLDGVVTITRLDGTRGPFRVRASWRERDIRSSQAVECMSYDAGGRVARAAADGLDSGRRPDLQRHVVGIVMQARRSAWQRPLAS